jgi:hypothetical protein
MKSTRRFLRSKRYLALMGPWPSRFIGVDYGFGKSKTAAVLVRRDEGGALKVEGWHYYEPLEEHTAPVYGGITRTAGP